jgi:hypothetical protein
VVPVGAVLGLDLPVPVVGVTGRTPQYLQTLRGLIHDHVDDLGGLPQVLEQCRDVGVEAAEEKTAVAVEPCDPGQVVRTVGVELLRITGVPRVLDLEQPAVVAEGPPVERARQRGAVVLLAAAQHGAPMAAGIDERVEFALLVPGDDDRLPPDVGREVVADVRDLAFVREVDPVPLEDVLHFEFEEFLVGENAPVGAVNAILGILDECVFEGVSGAV